MLPSLIILGVVLLVALSGGRHLLGCAWHFFLAGVVVILVILVILVFLARRAGYA